MQIEVIPCAGGGAPPEGWPHSGEVEFQEVSACYRPGLPPVLNALSFTVKVWGVGGTLPVQPQACVMCAVSALMMHCNLCWLMRRQGVQFDIC